MPRHAKAKKFKRGLSQNQERRSKNQGAKICMDITLQLFLYIMKVKSRKDQLFCTLNFSDVMWKPPIRNSNFLDFPMPAHMYQYLNLVDLYLILTSLLLNLNFMSKIYLNFKYYWNEIFVCEIFD